MSHSMSKASLSPFTLTLEALGAVLDKAGAHAAARKIDPAVLAATRLFPDMLPMSRQVQIAADQAKNGSARLAGIEPPKFEDNETTLEQLKARVVKTVAFLKTIDPAKIDAAADKEIVFPVGPNKMKMNGGEYLSHFVLPNFYFHAAMTYALLRECGVEIGKRDFLGAVPMTPA